MLEWITFLFPGPLWKTIVILLIFVYISYRGTQIHKSVQPVQFWVYSLTLGLVTANIFVRLGFISFWSWPGIVLLYLSVWLIPCQYSGDFYKVLLDLFNDIRGWMRSSRDAIDAVQADNDTLQAENEALRMELDERPTKEDHKELQNELSRSQLDAAHARNYASGKDKEIVENNETWSKLKQGDVINSQQLRIQDLESEVKRIDDDNISLKKDLRDARSNEASTRLEVTKNQKAAEDAHDQQQAQINDLTNKTQILERVNDQQKIKLEQFADVMEMLNRCAEEANRPELRRAAVLLAKTMKDAGMDLTGINISEQKLETLYSSLSAGPAAAVQPRGNENYLSR
jgi:predicted transcriptional regulator